MSKINAKQENSSKRLMTHARWRRGCPWKQHLVQQGGNWIVKCKERVAERATALSDHEGASWKPFRDECCPFLTRQKLPGLLGHQGRWQRERTRIHQPCPEGRIPGSSQIRAEVTRSQQQTILAHFFPFFREKHSKCCRAVDALHVETRSISKFLGLFCVPFLLFLWLFSGLVVSDSPRSDTRVANRFSFLSLYFIRKSCLFCVCMAEM